MCGARIRACSFRAIIDGGGHERGMRSGTLNVPGIVGLGKACAIAQEEMATESRELLGLRDRLRDRIMGTASTRSTSTASMDIACRAT